MTSPTPPPDRPPRSVGPYQLEDLVGRGGMGEVYRAYDRRLGRRVAIKHIRPDREEKPRARERFRREARLVARLNHPTIVQVHDVLERHDGDWIVMELVEGSSVARLMEGGALDLRTVVPVARQLAEGLAAAHDRGLVHRDLKAENVMLDPSGRVRILDFGLAKPMTAQVDGASTLSLAGEVLGTCRAMSPEQARGLEVGPPSDLFSLGTLIYEMTTGVSPFRGETNLDTLARVITHFPPPPDQLNPGVLEALSELVMQLLEKAPESRPADARQVAGILAALEVELGQTAGPPPAAGPAPALEEASGESTRFGSLWESQAPGRFTAAADSGASFSPPRGPWLKRRALPLALLLALGLGWLLWESGKTEAPPETVTATAGPDAVQALYRQGMEGLARGAPDQVEGAIHSFRQALALAPNSAANYAGLGRALLMKYRAEHQDTHLLEQALAAAEEAVALEGYLAEARLVRALIYLDLGRQEEARSDLEAALELAPGLAEAHWGWGRFYELRNLSTEAEEAFRRAVDGEPTNRRFWDSLGAVLLKSGRYPEAEEAFLQSIELDPNSIYGYRNLATLYFFEGRSHEAAAQLQEALKIRPDSTLYSSLGTIFFSQGLYGRAAEAFERALEKNANKYLYWANLGDALRWLPDRGGEARQAYRRALQLLDGHLLNEPEWVHLRSQRALYLARLDEREEALAEAARVAAIPDLDPYACYRLALVHEILGQRSQALEHLKRALERGFSLPETARDPDLLELRTDPRYHRLIADLAPP